MSDTNDTMARDNARLKRRAREARAWRRCALRRMHEAIRLLELSRDAMRSGVRILEAHDLDACVARLRLMLAAHEAAVRNGATLTQHYFLELCNREGRPSDQPLQLGAGR